MKVEYVLKPGDRIRVADDAPVLLARNSDRLGTVIAVRADYARPLTAWVDSQNCEFDFDPTELTIVARAVYMTPELRRALMASEELFAADEKLWAEEYLAVHKALVEAKY
jgi:hypothetical protein